MGDILLGLAVVLLLCAGLFALGFRLGKRASPRVFNVSAVLAVAFVVLHVAALRDSLLLARLLPFSNLVVLGNWLPPAASFLAGLAWDRIPKRPWRRCAFILPLLLASLYSGYGRLVGSPPTCGDEWEGGVCIQTSFASCSVACAATWPPCA